MHAVLLELGVAFNLRPQKAISENVSILKDLHVAGMSLVKERTRLRNRSQVQTPALLKRQATARRAQIVRQIAELDTAISDLIAQEDVTARRHDIPCSIPGSAR